MDRRTEWLAVLLPAALVGSFEFFRHRVFEPFLPGMAGNLLSSLVAALAVYAFVRLFARIIRRTEADLSRASERAAVMSERQRIAREMHDGVAQAMFYLNVKLDRVDERLAAGHLDAAQQEVTGVRSNIQETYRQVRAVIADLKQAAQPRTLAEALRGVVSDFAARSQAEPCLRLTGDWPLQPKALEHIGAIVHEALVNADRHGGATQITVGCDGDPAELRLWVRDNGKGFDVATAREGYGLAIMAERARAAGGCLAIKSRPGAGTRVELRIKGESV